MQSKERRERPVALPKLTKKEKWNKAMTSTEAHIEHLCNLVFRGSGTVITTISVNDDGDINVESKDLYDEGKDAEHY
jgi:hypothetical protein